MNFNLLFNTYVHWCARVTLWSECAWELGASGGQRVEAKLCSLVYWWKFDLGKWWHLSHSSSLCANHCECHSTARFAAGGRLGSSGIVLYISVVRFSSLEIGAPLGCSSHWDAGVLSSSGVLSLTVQALTSNAALWAWSILGTFHISLQSLAR